MIELDILRLFVDNKIIYSKYYNFIDLKYLKLNYNIIYKLYNIINIYYSKYPDKDKITFQDLESLYLINYPILKDIQKEELTTVLGRLQTCNPNVEVVTELLDAHRIRSLANDVAKTALDVAEGKVSTDELLSLFDNIKESSESSIREIEFVTTDLDELYEKQVKKLGLRWRLEFLNHSLGSLRKGDFGFVFARPETGKTTFLADQATYMANQAESKIIWFNNEEQHDKVMLRCYQAALAMTAQELFKDRKKSKKEYFKATKDNLKIIDEDIISKALVESVCKQHQPSLVIFDQIDKIVGFDGDRNDLVLGKLYQWARDLAKRYCPVIGVCQSDASGEGQKWLTMANVADAKTSKQAEADWILGIGKSHEAGTGSLRYLNISKNKLYGDEDSLAELRHGRGTVLIEPDIARYRMLKVKDIEDV